MTSVIQRLPKRKNKREPYMVAGGRRSRNLFFKLHFFHRLYRTAEIQSGPENKRRREKMHYSLGKEEKTYCEYTAYDG